MARHLIASVAGLASVLLLAACGPSSYMMTMEVRKPSESPIDLNGKTISVVYLEDSAPYDTAFSYHVADGLAKKIEEDFFDGEVGVTLFKLPRTEGDYSSKDTLVNLVMDTENDVIFLLDQPKFGKAVRNDQTNKWTVPFQITLHAYDSMGPVDSVYTFTGSSTLEGGVEPAANSIWNYTQSQAFNAGYSSASKFSPEWKEDSIGIVYYDYKTAWMDALDLAYEFKWEEAMDKWMTLTNTHNHTERACAEYNLAVGCYVTGKYELSRKWLELSDKDGPISLSRDLSRKLKAKNF